MKKKTPNQAESEIRPLTVFPTRDSLDAVVQEAEARAPIQRDEVYPLLATYHNTLLELLKKKN